MSAPIDELELVVRTLSQAVNVKYAFVSAIILLLYDTIIGVSDEINLIWRQHWSLEKVLYIITRYGCFIDAVTVLLYCFSPELSLESCRVVYQFGNWMLIFGVFICKGYSRVPVRNTSGTVA